MATVRWGIIGCGDVCEIKSGPGFQKADGSALVAVMRRDRDKADDFARRHGVPRVHATAAALVADPDVDAVYIATPPSSHCDLALQAAAAGKPCLVEKPMARTHAECVRMIEAFQTRGVPLWVAYYRRALPRFVAVRDLLGRGAIGRVTSVHVDVRERLAEGNAARVWRFDRDTAGAGLFLDLASHAFDLLDFLLEPIAAVSGYAVNTGGAYEVEDATCAAFRFGQDTLGTGLWNFNADEKRDRIVFTGTRGELTTPIFSDTDVVVESRMVRTIHPLRNPPHVHQPLIQTIVDELHGRGTCPSTGDTAARASWVMDECLKGFRQAAAER